jgi:hypothetical protein
VFGPRPNITRLLAGMTAAGNQSHMSVVKAWLLSTGL